VAVLTEPLAIGRHAVRRARVAKQDVAVVLGCGPIGLAVVLMLKAGGVGTEIDGILTAAPLYTRVVVVGVCSQRDHIRPVMAINKEIDLRFVVGYTPLELRDTLHLLADGKVDASPLVTGAPSALRASTRRSRPCGSPNSTPRS
jgi:threonine dehydrogenase-like Zn-dependent dehydrogenase